MCAINLYLFEVWLVGSLRLCAPCHYRDSVIGIFFPFFLSFLSSFVFLMLSLELCRDVHLMFACAADHVPDWQPRVLKKNRNAPRPSDYWLWLRPDRFIRKPHDVEIIIMSVFFVFSTS